jgi:tetratricopeptide (TPR) repeat protein
VVISGISLVRLSVFCSALSLVLAGVSSLCAQGQSARSWEDCLKAPDRTCVLDKAIGLVDMLDRTDRRQALVAAVAETWAQAGEIDTATQLAAQVPDRLPARMEVLREIAAALARASHPEKAEAAFDQALQLTYGGKNGLQRAETLYSIAKAQAAVGMKAAADTTFDQALQAAVTVRIIGEKGRVTVPAPETQLALLLQKLAMRQAEAGEIGQALQIARSIRHDLRVRARTLVALADLQTRAGAAAEATLDEAVAAEHDARASMAQWPSVRDSGMVVKENNFGDARLLSDIANAQTRAGLIAKAVASFDEALRAAQAIVVPGPALGSQDAAIADALAGIADAQREAGFTAVARATLDRAALAAEATFGLARARALARLAEVRTKAGDAAQDIFARALSVARALPDNGQRAQALQTVATAQADAGLRDDGAHTFAEAIGLARLQSRQILGSPTGVAIAQCRAGLFEEAAATFEEALTATISDNEKWKTYRLVWLTRLIVGNSWGKDLVAASPTLRTRLVEAAEAIIESGVAPAKNSVDPLWPPRGQAAEVLSAIARALPN